MIKTFKSDRIKYWCTEFALNPSNNILAMSTCDGQLQLWNMRDNGEPTSNEGESRETDIPLVGNVVKIHQSIKIQDSVMRHIAFTSDGRTLLAVGDNGAIHRFCCDRIRIY